MVIVFILFWFLFSRFFFCSIGGQYFFFDVKEVTKAIREFCIKMQVVIKYLIASKRDNQLMPWQVVETKHLSKMRHIILVFHDAHFINKLTLFGDVSVIKIFFTKPYTEA